MIDIWSIERVEQLSLENSEIVSNASGFDNVGLWLHNVSSVIEQLDEKWKNSLSDTVVLKPGHLAYH